MTTHAAFPISPDYLGTLIQELGSCGEQLEGGLIRPQYSASWLEARNLLEKWMNDGGLKTSIDSVGNLFGRLVGEDDSKTILTGSHLDTVYLGGKYDGGLGILSSLTAVLELKSKLGTPKVSIDVVALCEEEGSRFHANYFGTRSILGMVNEDELTSMVDADGIIFSDAMKEVGLVPEEFKSSIRTDLIAFIELHIEQGPVLHNDQIDIGVVTAITALAWMEVTVEGRADHAGTTPMDSRLDALQFSAELVQKISEVASKRGRPAVTTIGIFKVFPGGANIVPGRVEFSIDLRHPDEAILREMVEEVRDICRSADAKSDLKVMVHEVKFEHAVETDNELRELIIGATEEQGLTWRYLASGAGHDAQTMALRIPSAMIFVPSVNGRSHSKFEYTTNESAAIGVQALAATLAKVAY